MNMNENITKLIKKFSNLDEVEGILLAGSYALGTNDRNSDYDLYIYSSTSIDVSKRKKICDEFFEYIELNNTFWETEDDGFLKDKQIPVEIIYRNISWITENLDRVVYKFEADAGYTTCVWYNFINSVILYDKNGLLKELQKKYRISYPKELKENIVRKNYALLKGQMPAYYYQIEKALKRDDLISVNHRVAAFLASYFDIIFALNEFPHPGEKKILKVIKDNNLNVPDKMEETILNILKYSCSGDKLILEQINLLIYNLKKILDKEGFKY